MSLSLLAQLRAGALAFPGLTALLGGTNPNVFRWSDTQLDQGTAFPAVVATLISAPAMYSFSNRMQTNWNRVQFDIWGYDPEAAYIVQQQLAAFLDNFNGYGIANLPQYANQIMNVRKVLWPDTQPPQFQLIIDARIFFNSTT